MISTLKIEPKRTFIDTSAWIELILEHERYHQEVTKYFLSEINNGSKLFTSDQVLSETYTRLITRQSVTSAHALRKKVKAAEHSRDLLTLWTDESIFKKAWELFIKYAEHRMSFTDATIAVYVADLKLDEILTLDQGFLKIGLQTKPAI